jgi:hypothetical protein
MLSNRTIWTLIYSFAFIIFFGGWFVGVQYSPYFPVFVVFCMVYGAGVAAFMWFSARRK